MRRKFKFKKSKTFIFKVLFFFLLSYIVFSFMYRLLYKNYFTKLNNKELVDYIIKENIREENTSFFQTYFQPNYILKHTIAFETKELELPVIKENEVPIAPIIPSVYIYSTHEKEEYSNKYFENYNISPTVITASYILKDYLEDYNIASVIEEGSVTDILKQNNWSYARSYDASKILIENKIKEQDYKLIIDLHRDAIPLNYKLLEYNEKKYAKILFVVGAEHEGYEQNLALANTLNDLLNKEVPNITRGISKKSGTGVNGIYNQNLSPKSVLIELGGQYNEIEELNNTIEVLAKVILTYLEGDI